LDVNVEAAPSLSMASCRPLDYMYEAYLGHGDPN
jgi:hypothetical protein